MTSPGGIAGVVWSLTPEVEMLFFATQEPVQNPRYEPLDLIESRSKGSTCSVVEEVELAGTYSGNERLPLGRWAEHSGPASL
jgi:hypothetical protein